MIPAARSQSVEPVEMPVRSVAEIDRGLEDFDRSSNGSIVILPDSFTALREIFERVIAIAARDRIPAIYPYSYMARVGGLMSYGTDNADLFRRAATYVHRILKGAAPAELPVQLPIPTKTEDFCRRDYRVMRLLAAPAQDCFWHLADMSVAAANVRF
jgi:putative ABC transport system substrate-binding protein